MHAQTHELIGEVTYGLDLEGWRPLVLEDVEADATYERDKPGMSCELNLVNLLSLHHLPSLSMLGW